MYSGWYILQWEVLDEITIYCYTYRDYSAGVLVQEECAIEVEGHAVGEEFAE